MTFPQDALLLVGHGSLRYPDAGRWLHEHAEALRAGGKFAETGVAVLRGAPTISDVLETFTAPVVRVVPFFIEDGFFTRTVIPEALGRAEKRHGDRLWYGRAIGLHTGMAALIRDKVAASCVDHSNLSVVLVGHGSARRPGQNRALHELAAILTEEGRFAQIRMGFLEEAPYVADVLKVMRMRRAAVVGVFAGDGGHARDDLPGLVSAERARRDEALAPLTVVGPICQDAAMLGIILDQAAHGGWLEAGCDTAPPNS